MDEEAPRRPARGQSLSNHIRLHLQMLWKLDQAEVMRYSRDLYDAGWTLRAIGEAFDPPVSRYTVRNWVRDAVDDNISRRVDPPQYATPATYTRKTPIPTTLTLNEELELNILSNLARKRRAGSADSSTASIASDELDKLVIRLLDKGCAVADLALYAGVSRKSMYARINRIRKAST